MTTSEESREIIIFIYLPRDLTRSSSRSRSKKKWGVEQNRGLVVEKIKTRMFILKSKMLLLL